MKTACFFLLLALGALALLAATHHLFLGASSIGLRWPGAAISIVPATFYGLLALLLATCFVLGGLLGHGLRHRGFWAAFGLLALCWGGLAAAVLLT